MAAGLEEGFHVLRSRAFVGRGDGSSIFRTNAQVFYYDTARPAGDVPYPAENAQLGGSSYGVVVRTDPSVTEVWYLIDDLDSGNDSAADGNGAGNWQLAAPVATPSTLGKSGYAKEWRLTYRNIPASGIANLVVRLKEASSSADMSLGDEAGHYTTLQRHVSTGSPIDFNIGFPTAGGEVVDSDYVMKVYFKKELIPAEMSDQEFLDGFSIYISSSVSGQPDGPVLQPRSGYTLVRNATATEHSVEFTFPNLYNGMPDFLHTVRAEYTRGSLTLGDSVLVKMRADDRLDSDGDGLPDWWERFHGLEPYNPAGRHGADGDIDEDGIRNMDEYLFGMNPAAADAGNMPKVTISPDGAGGWKLGFPTIPNRKYRWQVTEDFSAGWRNLGATISTEGAASAGMLLRPESPAEPRRFYRMTVSPLQ
jgi:hypothetical protein